MIDRMSPPPPIALSPIALRLHFQKALCGLARRALGHRLDCLREALL